MSIDWLIKGCYQDSRQSAQPADFRDISCCVRANKVMCSLNECYIAGGVAM